MIPALNKFLFILIALIVFIAPVQATDSFSIEQKEGIEGVVKDYILENPEILIEALDIYKLRKEEEHNKHVEKILENNLDTLISTDAPSAGNPDGEIVVVEFFDYNCGWCRKALQDIQTIIKNDKDVRIVFKEMPLLGQASMLAAQWAMAAHKQGKYFEYHVKLMEYRGTKDEDYLKKIAKKLNLNLEQMKKDVNSEEINALIMENMIIARQLAVNGTPAFIIDGKILPGYLGKDGLKRSIKDARKNINNQ